MKQTGIIKRTILGLLVMNVLLREQLKCPEVIHYMNGLYSALYISHMELLNTHGYVGCVICS